MAGPQARNWVFTLNNPDGLLDLELLSEQFGITYVIYSEEVGENGNHHFQGYVQLNRSRKRAYLQKALPGAHFEPQRAKNSDDARNYCAKVDDPTYISGPYEYGTYRKTGARTDLMAVKADLDSGVSESTIADNHFGAWVRYHKSFRAYVQLKAPKRTEIHSVIGKLVIYVSNLG